MFLLSETVLRNHLSTDDVNIYNLLSKSMKALVDIFRPRVILMTIGSPCHLSISRDQPSNPEGS